jgi:hypothetical protein
MTTKKKTRKKAAAPKRRAKAAARGFVIKVLVPAHVSLQGAELAGLDAQQRLDLASMGSKKTTVPPPWAADDKLWRKALRDVSPRWKRYQHPFAAVAYVYLRMGGTLAGASSRSPGQEPQARRVSARAVAYATKARTPSSNGGVQVERVELDELGYDDRGKYYGLGEPLWHVLSDSPYIDTVVRARSAQAARAQALERYQH